MQIDTFTHHIQHGWSLESFPELDSPATLVLVFGSPDYQDHNQAIIELTEAFPTSHIIGCSTAGEIFGADINDSSLAVAVARFDKSEVRLASTKVAVSEESYHAGQHLSQHLMGDDLRAVFILSNGTSINGSELVRGLVDHLPESVVITGGLAGDGDRFERTWVLNGDRLGLDYVCAVGLYGDHVRVGHGSKGGWDVFGPKRQVTHAAGNVLYELDGRPALDLYKEYLGDLAADLPSSALLFPLALSTNQGDEKSIVRTILSIDEDANSLTFAGDIHNGTYAQLMKANFDRLINGANEAALMASDPQNGNPTLSIAISCVGRRLVLGERTEEELEATLEVLPAGVKQIGFYSYGEISPYMDGVCELHNQTMTLTTIQEV